MKFLTSCAICFLLPLCKASESEYLERETTPEIDHIQEITYECCTYGMSFAQGLLKPEDCSSSTKVPSSIPLDFQELCQLTRDGCCRQYFRTKDECDYGVNVAVALEQPCSQLNKTAQTCCKECRRGREFHSHTATECAAQLLTVNTTQQLLAANAFRRCCQMDRCNENPCDQICKDDGGVEVTCSCSPGYQLGADGKSCEDINECLSGLDVCGNATCTNIDDGFDCICPDDCILDVTSELIPLCVNCTSDFGAMDVSSDTILETILTPDVVSEDSVETEDDSLDLLNNDQKENDLSFTFRRHEHYRPRPGHLYRLGDVSDLTDPELSQGSGVLLVKHSQTQVIPSRDPGLRLLWTGYSLFSKDLNDAGSCVPKFNTMPFQSCRESHCSSLYRRNDRSYWLTTGQPLTLNDVKGEEMKHYISRCAVFEVPKNVIAVHSQTSMVPDCPSGWDALWEGYSFVTYAEDATYVGQSLASPGSCLQDFRPIPVIECEGEGGYCAHVVSTSKLSYWLSVVAEEFSAPKTLTLHPRQRVARCMVCSKS